MIELSTKAENYAAGKTNEYFLVKTQNDYTIYNALTGKIVLQFTNHIFSNEHLVIFKQEDGIEVYDFRTNKTIVHFEGQYSFGKKFYFVKNGMLHGLNLTSSYINTIPYVGKVNDSDMLLNNYLLRLDGDYSCKKVYTFLGLGNGENEKFMSKTELIFPYYIESWKGEITPNFSLVKEEFHRFNKECNKLHLSYPNVYNMCLGIKITNENIRWEKGKKMLILHGEIITYPYLATNISIPFMVEGIVKGTIDFANCIIKSIDAIDAKE